MDVEAQVYLNSSLVASERDGAQFMSEGNGSKGPKTRKPYTITKQRERWSEEEHLRFIEALRLHGRAWRKIEEHIGTKTAVQIRSHAQKFFNKLEKKKEAGEVPDKEEDFTIPPPRPKRKPAKPYPRKDGVTSSGYTGTSQLQLSPQLQAAAQQQLHGGLAPTSSGHLPGLGLLNGLTHNSSNEVTDATVAAVTAAASAAAAAAAAAVVAAAGQEVQTHMQVHPPSCFPFFGMPPSALAQITPNGVSALDQAALLAQQAAAMKVAALRGIGGVLAAAAAAAADGVAPAAPDASNNPAGDIGMLGDHNGSDRGLVEATGTTDGTHISANAQLRGSDGDSACSRETDNQDGCPSLTMDVSWQSKLHQHQALLLQQQQHENGSSSPSAAAARSLAGLQAGGFDPSQLQWGMGRCGAGAAGGFEGVQAAAEAAALQNLPAFSTAQALAVLSNPLYLAAADRQYQHAALQAAAAAAAGLGGAADGAAAAARSNGRAASSGGGGGAAGVVSGRTKSRRTAPSVNSGSTGPPAGTKRMLEVGSEQCMLPNKKAARELSDTGEEGEGMEVSPSSPSIQEKELKAASQPSNTNGNTSGSNESDASKRRQGTAQGEGSNPTNGNSSGNGYSVKDSNTGTNTGTNGHTNGNGNGYSCGNGTSAFNPVGHHHHSHPVGHHHHGHQQPSRQANNYSSNQQQCGGSSAAANRHGQHHYGSHAAQIAAGEGSNGGNGASGTGLSARDEGRSSSDLEGPSQQLQLQQQQQLQEEQDDEVMDEPMGEGDADDGEQEEEQQQHHQQQHSEQAAHLHAIMASLHGMCSKNPLMLQQAYGAAAAAAATAQQIVANAMHGQQPPLHVDLQGTAVNPLAALQQHMRQQGSSTFVAPPVSQGFTPWQHSTAAAAAGTSEFGSSGSFIGNSLLRHSHAGASAAQQLQLQAAAGLVGLASSWGTSGAASSGGNSAGALYGSYSQQQHYHYHNHNHNHQQQQASQHKAAQQQHKSGLLPSMSGGTGSSAAAAAVAAAAGLQQLQQGLGMGACSGNSGGGLSANPAAGLHVWGANGMSGYSGLEALTRAASAGTLANSDGAAK